ncbi:MAG TPA: SLAP domain-containing protein [Clostridiaceae bacterium]|jgi:SLAP domain-containing protein|nr:SLAP domain-containing protein [Clostridiaceae bacterium]
MKKVFILITVLITVLTVGCARTENDILEYHEQTPSVTDSENKNPGIDESTEDPTKTDGIQETEKPAKTDGVQETDKPQKTEEPANETANPNNVFISNVPNTGDNMVVISPKYVYYDGNAIHMEAFIHNGLSTTVYNLHDVEIKMSNEDGLICDGVFGALEGCVISSNNYVVWTFYFTEESVLMMNADLSYLITQSFLRYNH